MEDEILYFAARILGIIKKNQIKIEYMQFNIILEHIMNKLWQSQPMSDESVLNIIQYGVKNGIKKEDMDFGDFISEEDYIKLVPIILTNKNEVLEFLENNNNRKELEEYDKKDQIDVQILNGIFDFDTIEWILETPNHPFEKYLRKKYSL